MKSFLSDFLLGLIIIVLSPILFIVIVGATVKKIAKRSEEEK